MILHSEETRNNEMLNKEMEEPLESEPRTNVGLQDLGSRTKGTASESGASDDAVSKDTGETLRDSDPMRTGMPSGAGGSSDTKMEVPRVSNSVQQECCTGSLYQESR
jgi:hypothetical protein